MDAILAAIGSPTGPLGSGAAIAVVLALAIECLALQCRLTRRPTGDEERDRYLESLERRLDEWRNATQLALAEDPARFGEVLAARRARREAPDRSRAACTAQEWQALERANELLLDLLTMSREIERDAERMLHGQGVHHARAEAATAASLCRSSTESLAAMLAANLESACRHVHAAGPPTIDTSRIRQALAHLPPGRARTCLQEALATRDRLNDDRSL